MAFRFSRAYVEFIHDDVVAYSVGPDEEPVSPEEYRDKGLIESACARPFQSAFGEDVFPTIYQKAAAFFHSLVCNHCFSNGNKRTALVALDQFLAANDLCLLLNNNDAYMLAKDTASHNADNRRLETVLEELAALIETDAVLIDAMNAMAIEDSREEVQVIYEAYCLLRNEVRANPLNQEVNQET